ncbi:putative UDP-glucosyl transferase 73B6 [Carex rostrata]
MALNPNNSNKKCRVFLIPQLMRGHLIPMTDFAKLLVVAHPDVEPTMVVTPGNAALIKSSLGQSQSFGRVQILTYPFPSECTETNVETMGVGSKEETMLINKSLLSIRPVHEELLGKSKPDVVVADSLFYWAPNVAAEYGIPCLFFFCSGVFPFVVFKHIYDMQPSMGFDDCHRVITVSNLPGPKIEMPVTELPNYRIRHDEVTGKLLDSLFRSLPDVFGIVVNTFRALEKEYCKEYERIQSKRAYFIGPVSLCNASNVDGVIHRGGKGDVGCLRWLDSKEDGSVVFVSFGSQCYFKSEQLHELAIGLEHSRRNFLWVVRGDNMEEWMPDGWEDRIAGRGFLVKGWAPQVAVLSHPATGAFMTHCGWNSVLEGVSAGVPMLTWPFAAEEFINEKLLVEVLGCAAKVWDGGKRSTREEEHELVPGSAIAHAVSKFMEPGSKYVAMLSKAKNVAVSALAAVQYGGSSHGDIKNLVKDMFGLIGKNVMPN